MISLSMQSSIDAAKRKARLLIFSFHRCMRSPNTATTELKDQMIRDRIVVGLQDLKLSEKLQLDHELTLTKAINQARQSEAVKKQQTLLRSDFKESTETKKEVDAVKTRRTPKFEKESSPFTSKKPFKNPSTHPPSSRCYRYGKSPGHTQKNCPAKDVTCHKCSERPLGSRLQVLQNRRLKKKIMRFSVKLGLSKSGSFWKSSVRFKIDTGADVTVIPERIHKMLQPLPSLRESRKTLFGPAETILPVRGCFIGKVQ